MQNQTQQKEPMSRLAQLNGQYAAYALANTNEFVRVSPNAWVRKPLLDTRTESESENVEIDGIFHYVA